MGLSNELISADVEWLVDGQRQYGQFMIRVDPVNYRKRRVSNLKREFAVQKHLEGSRIPVVKMHWYCEDPDVLGAEFYVMQRMSGRVLSDDPPYSKEGWFADLDAAERRTVWLNALKTMCLIHTADPDEFVFLRRNNSDGLELQQEVRHWRWTYEWATSGRPNPVAERGWAWLMQNIPTDYPRGLCWGDAYPRNMMFEGLECIAVLDWEDVSLSSPLLDLARWLLADRILAEWGYPRLEGVLEPSELLSTWRMITGYSDETLPWFQLLNYCAGAGNLARVERLQAEMFGKPVSAEARSIEFLNSIISEVLELVGA